MHGIRVLQIKMHEYRALHINLLIIRENDFNKHDEK